LKQVLLNLGMQVSHLDPALFYWWNKGVFSGVMCIHVDDILLAGTESFHETVVQAMKREVVVGTETDASTFKYIGVNIVQNGRDIYLHQDDYVDSLEEMRISKERASRRTDRLGKLELENYRALVGQLNWLGTQTRPDISFDVCELSSLMTRATVDDSFKSK
jgi:hypothetical protein